MSTVKLSAKCTQHGWLSNFICYLRCNLNSFMIQIETLRCFDLIAGKKFLKNLDLFRLITKLYSAIKVAVYGTWLKLQTQVLLTVVR